MTKPQLVKVRALFFDLQQVSKRGCTYFDTASFCCQAFCCLLFVIRPMAVWLMAVWLLALASGGILCGPLSCQVVPAQHKASHVPPAPARFNRCPERRAALVEA